MHPAFPHRRDYYETNHVHNCVGIVGAGLLRTAGTKNRLDNKEARMSFFSEFKNGMKEFGLLLAIIVNTALLAIVYIVGVGLTSIIAKSFKKDFLPLEKKKTYWEDIDDRGDHYRQF